jgi:hypothetical protein
MPNRAERRAAERAAQNRENAQHSTGPITEAGKQTVSQNRRTHGLIGRFMLQADENLADYELLTQDIYEEFNPQTATEFRLANSVIQHYWLMQRAIRLQELNFNDEKKLALYLRYQSTHERSYYKAQKELQNLQKESRKQEAEEAKTRLTNAKADQVEVDTACRQVMEVPMPGTTTIGFEQLTKACSEAIATLVHQNQFKTAASE